MKKFETPKVRTVSKKKQWLQCFN